MVKSLFTDNLDRRTSGTHFPASSYARSRSSYYMTHEHDSRNAQRDIKRKKEKKKKKKTRRTNGERATTCKACIAVAGRDAIRYPPPASYMLPSPSASRENPDGRPPPPPPLRFLPTALCRRPVVPVARVPGWRPRISSAGRTRRHLCRTKRESSGRWRHLFPF